jgi:methionyl-tRNA formyltransferase
MKDLRVSLSSFEGPLDLLLYLVQQEEVDIYEISISRIADRFLEICRAEVQTLDVDQAGEFLVMASQLLVLKSRALLPRDDPVDLEEIDPRLDLVRQLLEYRRFKGVSVELAARWDLQKDKTPIKLRKPKTPARPDEELVELDLYGLVSAFGRLLKETGDETTVHMAKERLPITHFVGQIFDQLTRMGGRTGFRSLIGPTPDRTVVIGAFLALLELMKIGKIRVLQDGLGDITVEIRAEALALTDADNPDAAAHLLDDIELEEEAYSGPKIVYMGSPEFAVPALRSLVGAGFPPRLIVTPPPRRAGRGRRMQQVALAREAETLQLPLHRTNDVNGRASRDEIKHCEPDLIITAGFGQKLGSAILELPKHGCLNLHTSLLPAYRGASPVAAAIRDGLVETGVTIFKMDAEMDRGPMLGNRAVPIGPDDTTDDVTVLLAEAAADLIVRLVGPYLEGEIELVEQDHAASMYVGRLKKADGIVDWNQPALTVRNQIRSVSAWPGAQTAWQPKVKHEPLPMLLIATQCLSAEESPAAPVDEDGEAITVVPGTVLAVEKTGIDVACAEGVLRLLRVRPSGKREMAVKDFLNARRIVVGDRFVAPKAAVASR